MVCEHSKKWWYKDREIIFQHHHHHHKKQNIKIEIKEFAKIQHAKLINSLDENALNACAAANDGEKKETDSVADQDVGGKSRVELKSVANAGNGLLLARDDH